MDDGKPTIYYRKDIGAGEWVMPQFGALRDLLNALEFPDDWELVPNGLGNFAVFDGRYTEEWPDGMRYYVGYIDLGKLEAHIDLSVDDIRDEPGRPEQYPPRSATWVERSDLEANRHV